MTRQEYENNFIVINEIIYQPDYTKTLIEVIENDETILVEDYTITKTAQEKYQEWQEQQNTTPQPSTEQIMLEYVADLDYRLSLKEMGL